MATETKKLKAEELDTLRELQSKYAEITGKFGQLKVEQILLKNQLIRLEELEKTFEKDYVETQKSETVFLKTLETTYGKVSINIETGEISE